MDGVVVASRIHDQKLFRGKKAEQVSEPKEEYVNTFQQRVTSAQRSRDQHVAELDALGPEIRNHLSAVLKTAKQDGDVTAGYLAGLAQQNLLLTRLYVSKFLFDNKTHDAERFNQEVKIARKHLDTLLTELQNPTRRALAEKSIFELQSYHRTANLAVDAINNRNLGVYRMDQIGPEVTSVTQEFRGPIALSMQDAGKEANEIGNQSMVVSGAILTLSVLAAAATFMLVVRPIVGRIYETNSVLQDIADGVGDVRSTLPSSGNDELDQLGATYNRFADKLADMIRQMAAQSSQLLFASEDIDSRASSSLRNAGQQHEFARDISKAVENMQRGLAEVEESATSLSTLSQETAESTQQCANIVEAAAASMNALSEQIQITGPTVEAVRSNSEEIGSVLEVIGSIAEQTNLLALNTAIEAARAGEQCRGFAVVADEVRSLASRTQDSAQSIQDIINKLQTESERANREMSVSRKIATESASEMDTAQSALQSIMENTKQVSGSVISITSQASQQTAVSGEISAGISGVSNNKKEVVDSAKATNQTAAEISDLGKAINGLVNQFRV